MRQTHFPPRVLAAALSACATESVILNSERIEQRFGSYGIDVLASEAGLRRSSLFSYDGDSTTCRTYAVVQFAEEADARYNDAHSRVLAGDSIGETFKDDGWDIRKNTLYVGTIRLPESTTQVGDLMRLGGAHDLALHIYQLVLVRDVNEIEYATILEAHHPEYLTERDLRAIFLREPVEPVSRSDLDRLSKLVFGV